MLTEFCRIAAQLNNALSIVPLLYGSLGLQLLTGEALNPDDIDVLIPAECLGAKWASLCELMERNGYTLIDLHEHTFSNGSQKISYAQIDDLESYADISLNHTPTVQHKGAQFFLLTLPQYLNVYKKSSEDSYRRDKNNSKDIEKIALIKAFIST